MCCGLCSPARVPDPALAAAAVGASIMLEACKDGADAVAIEVAVDDAAAAAATDDVLFDSLLLLLV